jgi:hypothetical protein
MLGRAGLSGYRAIGLWGFGHRRVNPLPQLRDRRVGQRLLAAPIGAPLFGRRDAFALPLRDERPLAFGAGAQQRIACATGARRTARVTLLRPPSPQPLPQES